MMEIQNLKEIVEAALLAAGKPLSLDRLQELFEEHNRPERQALSSAPDELAADYAGRGFEIREVSSGFRVQVEPSTPPGYRAFGRSGRAVTRGH